MLYRYDALNRRVRKLLDADGNGTYEAREGFVWDGTAGSRSYVAGDSGNPAAVMSGREMAAMKSRITPGHVDDVTLVLDSAGRVDHRYLHGRGVNQILADEVMSDSNQVDELLWALEDHQGSVRDWADYDTPSLPGNTKVVSHVELDAFGQVTDTFGDDRGSTYSYTGRYYDADAGLYYYRARWYDPVAGRFISEDPIGFAGGDANLAAYVGNDAATAVDPTGLDERRESRGGRRGAERAAEQYRQDQGRLNELRAVAIGLVEASKKHQEIDSQYEPRPHDRERTFPPTGVETAEMLEVFIEHHRHIGPEVRPTQNGSFRPTVHWPWSPRIYIERNAFEGGWGQALGTLTHEAMHGWHPFGKHATNGFANHDSDGFMIPPSGDGTVEGNVDELIYWAERRINPETGDSLMDEIVEDAERNPAIPKPRNGTRRRRTGR